MVVVVKLLRERSPVYVSGDVAPQRVGHDAAAERLRQAQQVPRSATGIRPEALRRNRARHGQPVERLRREHRMTTDDRDAIGVRDLRTAAEDQPGDVRIEVGWDGKDCQREAGHPAHRVDVRDRVRRSDAAVVERVVDDGTEQIDRLHEQRAVVEPYDRGIVEGRA